MQLEVPDHLGHLDQRDLLDPVDREARLAVLVHRGLEVRLGRQDHLDPLDSAADLVPLVELVQPDRQDRKVFIILT